MGNGRKQHSASVKNVAWQAGATQVLNNICFDLRAGEFKLITGQSGCGKSTLLKIVASLMSPTAGEILFEGKEINTLKPETYRQQVSYCAQTPALFGDTVYDNLIFPGKSVTNVRIRMCFWPIWLVLSSRDDPQKSINELSGGEKQRVSLIRNLQFLPKILLLDEITSALDEANKRNVNELIHHYVRDKNIAVLWVTHDKDEINHADNVIILQPHAGEMQEARNERA